MKFKDFIRDLNSSENVNETLEVLSKIVTDKDTEVYNRLAELTLNPSLIEDTNNFAFLLADLQCEESVGPLTEMIMKADLEHSSWLADYMYALGRLLDESEIEIEFKGEFIHRLGTWLFNTGGGEIAWKSAIILSNAHHEACYEYLIKGVKDKSQLHLTRNECLKGIVNQYGNKELKLYKELLNDEDSEIREAAKEAIAWLSNAEG